MKTRNMAAATAVASFCLAASPAMGAVLNPVLGRVDGIAMASSGEVMLVGWACNKGWSWSSPQVDVYAGGTAGAGGTKLGVYWTDQPTESDVSQHCETSGINHRFAITLTISMRQQFAGKPLYVYGFAMPTQGNNVLLNGSGQYTVPAAPAVADSVYYIHADRLGSNVVMTDTNARVVARTEYTAYGAAAQNTNKNETAGYTGHYEDPLTGLTYMQARYYDADLGRFLSIDPVGTVPGDIFNFARYAYANNNPMLFTDPTGMVAQACKSEAVIRPDGSWVVTGSGCEAGSGGGVAGWYPGWGGGSPSEGREPSVGGGGGGRPVTDLAEVTAEANRPPDINKVRWSGTTWAVNGTYLGVAGGWHRFQLVSECLGGHAHMVNIDAFAGGGDFGLPFSVAGSWVTFLAPAADPSVFNGKFVATGAGAALGVGYGRSGYQLGQATARPSGGLQAGIGISAGLYAGSSKVSASAKFKCYR